VFPAQRWKNTVQKMFFFVFSPRFYEEKMANDPFAVESSMKPVHGMGF
jgi:hypothetical protein